MEVPIPLETHIFSIIRYIHIDMQWWWSLFLHPSSQTVKLSSSSMPSKQIGHICSSSSLILFWGREKYKVIFGLTIYIDTTFQEKILYACNIGILSC